MIHPSIPTYSHHGVIHARHANTRYPRSRSPKASPPVRCVVCPSVAEKDPVRRLRRLPFWPHSHRLRLHPADVIPLSPSPRCPTRALHARGVSQLLWPIPRFPQMGKLSYCHIVILRHTEIYLHISQLPHIIEEKRKTLTQSHMG